MCTKKFHTLLLCFAVALLATASVASAEVIHDYFNAQIDTQTNYVEGNGTGFDNGHWYEYPQGSEPSWWNQWFFNGGDINGSKWIGYDMFLWQIGPFTTPPVIEVAMNWSGPEWVNPLTPPTPQLITQPGDIVRQTIFNGIVEGIVHLRPQGEPIEILDFNPVWISIDVRAIEPGVPMYSPAVGLFGHISHEHIVIPEPSSLIGLFSLSVVGLVGYGLRRRKSRA